MSPRSFASPLPWTPPSREEWRQEKASQIEPRGRGEQGFSNDEKFNEDWVIILSKYLIYLIFSRFQTYHTFHSPALTFSLQVFRFRQQDTNSRTFQFGQRISSRLSTFSSSCSTHSKMHVQLTVNHVNYSDASFVHEAVEAWVESVNTTQFTACVTRAGRTTTWRKDIFRCP